MITNLNSSRFSHLESRQAERFKSRVEEGNRFIPSPSGDVIKGFFERRALDEHLTELGLARTRTPGVGDCVMHSFAAQSNEPVGEVTEKIYDELTRRYNDQVSKYGIGGRLDLSRSMSSPAKNKTKTDVDSNTANPHLARIRKYLLSYNKFNKSGIDGAHRRWDVDSEKEGGANIVIMSSIYANVYNRPILVFAEPNVTYEDEVPEYMNARKHMRIRYPDNFKGKRLQLKGASNNDIKKYIEKHNVAIAAAIKGGAHAESVRNIGESKAAFPLNVWERTATAHMIKAFKIDGKIHPTDFSGNKVDLAKRPIHAAPEPRSEEDPPPRFEGLEFQKVPVMVDPQIREEFALRKGRLIPIDLLPTSKTKSSGVASSVVDEPESKSLLNKRGKIKRFFTKKSKERQR